MLLPLVIRFLYDGIKRIQIRIAGRHLLAWAGRDDAGGHHSLLLGECVILRCHVLLLTDETIKALDVIGTQLIRLIIPINALPIARATSHIFQFDMIGVEVLNYADVVAVLPRYLHVAAAHHHPVVHIPLHIRRHLRPIKAARASLLIVETVQVLAASAAVADGADLVLMLSHRMELLIFGIVDAIV